MQIVDDDAALFSTRPICGCEAATPVFDGDYIMQRPDGTFFQPHARLFATEPEVIAYLERERQDEETRRQKKAALAAAKN